MKKILFSALMLGLVFSGCKKDDDDNSNSNVVIPPPPVPATQQAVGLYFSGNWCGPCGLYGKPALKNIKTEFNDKLVLVACQLNGGGSAIDPMNNADANSLASVFQVSGVPTIYLGASDQQITSVSGGSAMETNVRNKVNTIVALSPVARISGTKTISGNSISVSTNVSFEKEVQDEWDVAVYVLENSIKDKQFVSGQGWQNDVDFSHILRAKLSSNVVGDAITTSGAAKGKSFEKTFTGTLDSKWVKGNLEIAVVLWKKKGNTVSMENGVIIK